MDATSAINRLCVNGCFFFFPFLFVFVLVFIEYKRFR